MNSPTRADLENAAQKFFRTLERELHQPRSFNPDNLLGELDFNLEESRARIGLLDQQLVTNVFDRSVHARADALLEGIAVGLDALEPPQRLLTLQLAARAEREQLLELIHLLKTPIQPYTPEDPMFRRAPVSESGSPPHPAMPAGPTLQSAAEAYIAKVKAKKLSASHQNELARALRWLQECTGAERPIASISKSELRAFRDDVERLSANLQGSSLPFKGRFAASPNDRIKSVTAKRYWQSVQGFFAWGADEGYLEDSPAASLKIQTRKGEGRRTPEPFSVTELKALFATPLYAGYRSGKRLGDLGTCAIREGHWWSGVLLVHTGLRASELSQILASDFDFDHEVPHLKIREEDDTGAKVKSAKTSSSVRDVPLHPNLLALGLRQFVDRRAKARPKDRIFHEFRLGVHGRTSDGMTKFWGMYLKRFDLWKPGRSTHVFRHTLAACLRANEASDEEIGALLGHSPQTVTAGYGGAFPLSRKLKAVHKINYGFDIVDALGGSFDPKRH